MSGTKAGGMKCVKILKQKYGNDYYKNLGKLNKYVPKQRSYLKDNPDIAKKIGAIGGKKGKRGRQVYSYIIDFTCDYLYLFARQKDFEEKKKELELNKCRYLKNQNTNYDILIGNCEDDILDVYDLDYDLPRKKELKENYNGSLILSLRKEDNETK